MKCSLQRMSEYNARVQQILLTNNIIYVTEYQYKI